jgi:hypothetical protein
VYYNYNTAFPDYYDDNSSNCQLDYCCTWPWPGVFPDTNGNITTPPEFVDTNGWSNLRLRGFSFCIDAGNNAAAHGATDLDGRPRIINRVDIGAYEFVEPFNAWLQQYGLPTDGSADFIDSDSDGYNNYQESVAGTDPTNALSALRLLTPTSDLSGLHLTWRSVSNRTYFLERSTNLASGSFSSVASNVAGEAGTTTFIDTNAAGAGPLFYRVGVQR